ncbi:unnamed protein product [Owenia fusiformis]|uniref:Fibronectin type III-like domain-containing protein n=1 Tax=Owenia fusiformis TaxID=6347 RepID=A0A8S4NWR5_OWEFU|nr:unnamed protein product [Owenia fusiformis]
MARTAKIITVILLVFGSVFSKFPFEDITLSWDERVNDILDRLTLQEMQDQMAYGGSTPAPAPGISRLGIKPYQWDTECIRGDVDLNGTSFPQSIGLAASFNPKLLYEVAKTTAQEVRAFNNYFESQGDYGMHKGLSCFSPVLNIHRHPLWGRNQETYGEDPYMSGVYSQHFIWGLQGDHPRYVRASGGCKHFDVHGGPENIPSSRFDFDAKVSTKDWKATFQPAFKACVKAGTYSLMCSYNSINGIPSCANKELLTDILRYEWGFTGYVVSDDGAIENIITHHHYLNDSVQTAAACIHAGTNLNLPMGPNVYLHIVESVEQGLVTEETVKERVKPLFYTRMKLGEFDPPSLNPYKSIDRSIIQSPAHQALSLRAAMESFVLLKNEANMLPLKGSVKYGAILGPFADNPDQMFGDYTAKPDAKYITTPMSSLTDVIADKTYYKQLCDNSDPHCSTYTQAALQDLVQYADIVVLCLGTGQAVEAEGNDRPDMELPGKQKQMLDDAIMYTKGKIILLLFSAAPLDVAPAIASDKVSAIIHCFFPSQTTGEAIRRVLFNDGPGSNPAGRLPFTWYSSLEYVLPITNYTMVNRTYRYIQGDPTLPYGYGLSYSSFNYTSLTITPAVVKAGNNVTVVVGVRNIGKIDGDEVIQLYISWVGVQEVMPKYQLAGFDRVFLEATQENWYKFTITAEQMAVIDDAGRQTVVPCTINVYAGGQQPNQKASVGSNVLQGNFTIQA